MPPRIPTPSPVAVLGLCVRQAPGSSKVLPLVSVAHASTAPRRAKHKDQYALAQAKQRKMANEGRQAVLREERKTARGDPIRGVPKPFLETLSAVGTPITSTSDSLLNHFLTSAELDSSIKQSFMLSEPVALKDGARDPAKYQAALNKHREEHATAAEALARIMNLENGSSADKTRVNIRRCIEKFGRHNTDETLRPRAPPAPLEGKPLLPTKTPRAGPDTGSSEVQIAILTAKINTLADQMAASKGHKDKVNKKNLTSMVHRRQRLLRYMRTKERGSDRWEHLVATLGLSEATWKGEITGL